VVQSRWSLWITVYGITLFLVRGVAAQSVAGLGASVVQVSPPSGSSVIQQNSPQNSQAISQTGLLPLFSIDMQIDPSWVDGLNAPSSSPQFSHNGVNDTRQQAWEALRPDGFNMVRFPVSLDDPQAVVRMVNLCLWAKANNIFLIPILQGSSALRRDQSAMPTAVSAFISALVSRIRQGDPAELSSYTQISYYQLEGPMNHAGLYPNISRETAQQVLLAASQALRQSETQALQGTGIAPTPILVDASFDFELIQQGAIAGVALDPTAERAAQGSLTQFLGPLAAAPNIEAINVEWFPRSVSSGDIDHFASLLRVLKGSLTGKQLVLTTGFSSAFNPANQQMQFYAVTISNLGDFRASDGANSSFLGVVFRQAFKGANADATAPAGTSDPTQWNWSDRARQLSAMWSQGTSSAELSWWLSKVQDNMGLLALQPNAAAGTSINALPGQQAFQQIAATLTQASQNIGAPPSTPTVSSIVPSTPALDSSQLQTGTPGYSAAAQGPAQVPVSPIQQQLLALLQRFTIQMADRFLSGQKNSNPQGSNASTPSPLYPGQTTDPNGVQVTNPAATPITVTNTGDGSVPSPAVDASASAGANPTATQSGAPGAPTLPPPASADASAAFSPPSNSYVSQVSPAAAPAQGSALPAMPSPRVLVTFFGLADTSAAAAMGQIPSLSAEIANASDAPLPPGQAQVFVDDAPQQIQSVGPLLPRETHSLVFPSTPSSPGLHTLRVVVTTADGATASATTGANVTVASAANTVASAQTSVTASANSISVPVGNGAPVRTITPGSAPGASSSASASPVQTPVTTGAVAGPAPLGSAPVRTITPAAPAGSTPVRTIAPGSTQGPSATGSASSVQPSIGAARSVVRTVLPSGGTTNTPGANIRPLSSNSVRTITPGAAPAPPVAASAGAPRSTGAATPGNGPAVPSSGSLPGVGSPGIASGTVDLSVAPRDVHFTPASPKPGQPTMFTAVIRNVGTSAVQRASAVFQIVADGRQVAVSQPIVFNIAAYGNFQVSWSAPVPSGKQVQLVLSVIASGDVNSANNQVTVPIAVVPAASSVAPH
jgi:hypothetical protein